MVDNLQAIFIVLNDPNQTERVLELLLKCEMRGATIIESTGMSKVLKENIPVIGSVRALLSQQHEHNQTIFAITKHSEKIDQVIDLINQEFNGFKEPCSGMIFVVPVVKAIGFGKKDCPSGFDQDS